MSESPRTTEDVVTDHAYDGIQEFDNPLPRWWLMTFYGTVVFSIGYWMAYHSFSGAELPRQAYANEMKRAAEEEDARLAQLEREGKGVTEDQLWALSKDPKTLAAGEALFKQNCVVCHGDRAQGNVGPNLTDGYWLHGGKAKQVYQTVSAGVPEKAMPAWKPTLGMSKVQQVVSYVLAQRNKNVPGKPPQGNPEGGAEGAGAGGAPAVPADKGAAPAKAGDQAKAVPQDAAKAG